MTKWQRTEMTQEIQTELPGMPAKNKPSGIDELIAEMDDKLTGAVQTAIALQEQLLVLRGMVMPSYWDTLRIKGHTQLELLAWKTSNRTMYAQLKTWIDTSTTWLRTSERSRATVPGDDDDAAWCAAFKIISED